MLTGATGDGWRALGLRRSTFCPRRGSSGWVQIAEAVSRRLAPGQNFLFTHSSDAEFQLFNWKISGVAVGMILVNGNRCSVACGATAKVWENLVDAAGARVSICVRDAAAALPLWRYLPELAFLQFPWRWLGPLRPGVRVLRGRGDRQSAAAWHAADRGGAGARADRNHRSTDWNEHHGGIAKTPVISRRNWRGPWLRRH